MSESKYEIMLYPYAHQDKQHAQRFIGAIKNSILSYPETLSVAQIAQAATSGHSMIFGHAEYCHAENEQLATGRVKIGAGARHWQRQQLFAVDIDNEQTADGAKVKLPAKRYLGFAQALKLCQEANVLPAFAYQTFNYLPAHEKYRLVFVLDRQISDLAMHTRVMNALFNLFSVDGACIVDTKCCDPCRIFFPGKKLLLKAFGNIVNTAKLIEHFDKLPLVSKPNFGKNRPKVTRLTMINNEALKNELQCIKKLDAKKYLKIKVIAISKSADAAIPRSDACRPKAEQVYHYLTMDTCSAKSKAGKDPVFIATPEDYYLITRKIPLHLLLGYELLKNFPCILNDHNDTNPSARIEKNPQGEYFYHCYGCNRKLDIFDFVEHLSGAGHQKAKQFINELFNLSFETKWQIQRKHDIAQYQDFIWLQAFKDKFPALHKRLVYSNLLGTLNLLLQMGKLYIYDRKVSQEDKPVFYISLSLLLEKANDFGLNYRGKKTLHEKIKFLTRLGLIEILEDNQVPKVFKKRLSQIKRSSEQHYRINCFAIPEFSMQLFYDAQQRLEDIRQKGIRQRYYCREAELRANGLEAANKQFSQDSYKESSAKIDNFYKKYSAAATQLLTKGWTTEKEILAALKGYSKTVKDNFSALCLPQLLSEQSLQRAPYSKSLQELYHITEKFHYGSTKLLLRSCDHSGC